SIKNIALSDKTDSAIIPGGLTSIVQPLDVCINKPFKDRLREKWNSWMSSDQFTYTKCGISNAMDGSEDDLFGQMEEEIDENEREIVDIDSDSADKLEEEELE
ncbi:9172_t:CDS:2, partial [Paraglomus brasilianum]